MWYNNKKYNKVRKYNKKKGEVNMTYTLALDAADEALIERYAAKENLSVPDFMLKATKETIERRIHVARPKARDEMTNEEFDAMLERGMEDIRQGKVTPVNEVFAEIRRELGLNGTV
ncbi:hypothetical protein [Anaerovibrio lipolyticus]|nr:hypothetical protein [Anaerovibrio lipolyticus]